MEQKNIEGKTDEARSCAAAGSPMKAWRKEYKRLTGLEPVPRDSIADEVAWNTRWFCRWADDTCGMVVQLAQSMEENHSLPDATVGYQSPVTENQQPETK